MKKPFFILLLIFTIIIINTAVTFAAKTQAELQAEKEKIEAQEAKLKKENKLLKSEEKKQSSEYTELKNDLENVEDTIQSLEKKIKVAEEDYEKKKALFEKRIVSIIQNENFSKMELLINSKNAIEFYNKVNLLSEIMKQDKLLLHNLKSAQKEVDNNIILLQKIETTKKEATEKISKELSATEKELAKKQASLSANESAKLQIESEMEAAAAAVTAELSGNSSNSSEGSYSGGKMKWPVPNYTYLSSPYGPRTMNGVSKMHTGIDIAAPYGNSIVAAAAGKVLSSSYRNNGYGNTIIIDHGGGITTLYAHCSSLIVKSGSQVSAGKVIAKIGSTGSSTGNHLHFEVRLDGAHKNPQNYVSKP